MFDLKTRVMLIAWRNCNKVFDEKQMELNDAPHTLERKSILVQIQEKGESSLVFV